MAAEQIPDLSAPRRVHVVNVGGAGMSAIATVLAQMGHAVTGTDANDTPFLDPLRRLGVDIEIGGRHRRADAADVVVTSTATPDQHPDVAAARSAGVPVVHRGDALEAICRQREVVAVAGTHGKSTTSAMLATALVGAGDGAGYLVGTRVTGLGANADWRRGPRFVVEADESDATFLRVAARHGIVTNVEPDHLSFWGSADALFDGFRRFVRSLEGFAVLCLDDPGSAGLVDAARRPVTYGTDPRADHHVSEVEPAGIGVAYTHTVNRGAGEGAARVTVPSAPGLHNARNAAAAIATAVELGIDLEAAVAAIGSFAGVARRFEVRGEAAGVTFVDSYDHLPTEVVAALAAARSGPFERVVCVFQPHRYTRTRDLAATFADAFTDADVLGVTELYAAGEDPIAGISGRAVLDAVLGAHPEAAGTFLPDLDAAADWLVDVLRPGDCCLTLNAGDLTRVPDVVLGRLRGREWVVNADAVDVAAEILGPRATRDRSLAPFSTYKVGGTAALDVVVDDVEDLRLLGRAVQETGLDVLVVGKGSNLLVADAGFPGIAVRLGEPYEEVVIDGEIVHAGAATLLPVVARRTAAAGLTGFEWAVGVPGSMGGAVRMNAGGHGSDMAATLVGVRVFDLRKGEDGDVSAAELDLGYRSSAVGPHQVVTDATLRLRRGDPEAGKALISEIVAWRREHQPGGQNAGSVFTNPADDSAGRLVDLAGCKGLRRGTAAVSDKHANFIQADPGGSADDVFRVMVAVRDAVEERTGVRLHPETVLVGFDRTVFS